MSAAMMTGKMKILDGTLGSGVIREKLLKEETKSPLILNCKALQLT
jgi:hypothetical protein